MLFSEYVAASDQVSVPQSIVETARLSVRSPSRDRQYPTDEQSSSVPLDPFAKGPSRGSVKNGIRTSETTRDVRARTWEQTRTSETRISQKTRLIRGRRHFLQSKRQRCCLSFTPRDRPVLPSATRRSSDRWPQPAARVSGPNPGFAAEGGSSGTCRGTSGTENFR